MLLPVALLLAIVHFSVFTNAKPLKRAVDFAVKHSWADIPKGWEYIAPAPANLVFELKFGLNQPSIDDLIAELMQISDPEHSRYTEYLTKEEVDRFLAPHPDTVRLIDEWLMSHDIDPANNSTRRSKAGDWVSVRVTVEQAERMLDTKYHIYKHGASGDQVFRTLSYSLPKSLHRHVDVAVPTTYFGTLRSMKSTSFLQPEPADNDIDTSLESIRPCLTVVTPECLRSLYKTNTYTPQRTDVNKLGVAGFLNEYANYADLQAFFQQFRPEAVNSNFTTVLINGGKDDQNVPGVEANLDIQYTTGISFPTPNIYYSTGGSPPFNPDSFTPSNTNEPYEEFLAYLDLSSHDLPQVLTTSYGDDEQTVPYDYARRICNNFASLGARGTTVFFSSGDSGVGGGDCKTNDGINSKVFQPTFPASCPYVTAVGGTFRNPEVAVYFSGGGFSRYFERPSFQDQDVKAFLKTLGTKYQGLYNSGGRAYPDLAAQAQNFQVIVGGAKVSVGGTSASSPTVAAIFSLLNDARLNSGKASLGFINPLIYKFKHGFNDITSGSNPGCGTNGFTATTGWDPVTGLGTPDFVKLRGLC